MAVSDQYLYDSNIMRAPGSHASSIHSYGLFGEASQLPDVLHCETIAARSVLHSWELASHRHSRLHQLLLLREGSGKAWLESDSMALGRHTLVNVPVGNVHAFSFSPGTQGWVLSLPDELVAQQLANEPMLRQSLARAVAAGRLRVARQRLCAGLGRDARSSEPRRPRRHRPAGLAPGGCPSHARGAKTPCLHHRECCRGG